MRGRKHDVEGQMSVLRTKSIEQSMRDTEEPEHQLKKELSALDLTVFGIGVIIGTGIFVLTGVAANGTAGPAVAISFVIAGIACGLAALCYAELASSVPVAGSAYTFSYATMGELIAWIIGWDLILEFIIGGAVVAVGWSQYFTRFLDIFGITLPTSIASGEEGVFNLPAFLVVLLLTAVLVGGIKLSSRVNAVVVAIKILVVLFVIAAGLFFVRGENYSPFIPPAEAAEETGGLDATLLEFIFGAAPQNFGVSGIFAAGALVFFAFIGFDIVATTAEETKNPQRDLPRGILGSLLICTALYVAVSLVVVGMQNYTELDQSAPLAAAFEAVGRSFFADLITMGALAGLTTVMMILMLGQSRVAEPPRQPAAAVVLQGASHIRHAVPHHRHRRRSHCRPRRIHPAGRAGRAGQHRHAVRLSAGERRRHHPAPYATGPPACVPRAGGAPSPDAGRRRLSGADAFPHRRDVDPVPGMDGARLRRLLPLRLSQIAARSRWCRSRDAGTAAGDPGRRGSGRPTPGRVAEVFARASCWESGLAPTGEAPRTGQ
jgi:APA family basic amino acid/polyamine antiporter